MKFLIGFLSLTIMNSAMASWRGQTRATLREYSSECRSTNVVVDQIIKNEVIRGHVSGLPTDALSKFKVVFYVKTNKWYVHPYSYTPSHQEGYSYSNLDANGNFNIKTVRREFAASKMAVVVVPKSFKIPSSRWILRPFLGLFGGALKYQCNHTIVAGNGDFFTESL